MQIQHKQSENKGIFFVQPEGEEILAELTYHKHEPNTMIIEHTEVDDELRGQNVGYQLVNSAVEYARTQGMKITPLCTFAKAIMEKKPEFKDMVQ